MSPSPEVMPFPGGSLPQEVREGPAPLPQGGWLEMHLHSGAPLLCLGPLPPAHDGRPQNSPCAHRCVLEPTHKPQPGSGKPDMGGLT